jgi:hypothetical protein
MLPLNIVIPAVKRPIAMVFCGATTEAKVRTAECMSYSSALARGEREKKGGGECYLILGCRAPVGDALRIRYALFQSVSAKCADGDGGGAVEAAHCPERRHCEDC